MAGTATPAPFGSMVTAMVTPFDADGALDLDAAQAVARHLVDTGHDGIVVSGTTGESPTTSDSEKTELLTAVLDAVGDSARVVAGVGTNATAHCIELAQAAEKVGAHGILLVTPYYNKPPQDGIVAHMTAVCDSCGLDALLYDIPGRTGTPIATESLQRLAEHPRIVAVKDAKYDLRETSRVLASTDLLYYSGADELNLPLLAMGAVGVVSVVGHVAGREYRRMIDAVAAGDLDTARSIDRQLVPAVTAMMTRTQGVLMAKEALVLMGVLSSATVRLPLTTAPTELVDALRADLTTAGLL